MNSKHRKTLQAVFADPIPKGIEWDAIESLLAYVGCKTIEGSGSRVKFEKDGKVASFHRPHPERDAKRYQVEDAREYLRQIGVTP